MNVLIHYSEIGLKGKNRPDFERKLLSNIKQSFSPGQVAIKRLFGRFLLTTDLSLKTIKPVLEKVFGLASFSPCLEIKPDLKEIKRKTDQLLKESRFGSFAIRAKTTANFPLKGSFLEKEIGQYVKDKYQKKVSLDHPELTVFLEGVDQNQGFVYLNRYLGSGGLPVGISGKSISLISGGIDSPVASYLINSRGMENVFVHCHSYPQTSFASIEKVKKLCQILRQYQTRTVLYLVPILEMQKIIFSKADPRFLVLLYRRLMLRIAEGIAAREKAEAIITGDSLGQVASQTVANLTIQSEAIKLPIFRPLIAFSKEEIIRVSQKIKTYDISILAHDDCCQLFVPKNPKTKARIEDVLAMEKQLPLVKMIKESLDKTEIIDLSLKRKK